MKNVILPKGDAGGGGAKSDEAKDLHIETPAVSIGGTIHFEDPFDLAIVLSFHLIGLRSG